MHVFVCTDHDGHWPVGVASVVRADSEDAARVLLDEALKEHGLKGHEASPYTLKQLPENPVAVVLNNGDY